jgi:SPP1 family predicted phage head-tail adaptor
MPNLDRKITIQQLNETQDSTGHPVKSWTDFAANEPAEFMPLAGTEVFGSNQNLATVTARFRVRYRTTFTNKMRIVFESENWDIQSIIEDIRFSRKQYLLITAELVAAT